MTEADAMMLNQRVQKLLRLIANQFQMKKQDRTENLEDIYNRLARIKKWLNEPIIIPSEDLKPLPVDYALSPSTLTFDTFNKMLFPSDRLHISNTSFLTNHGNLQV